MALLNISEPGQGPSPHETKTALGIDLGTTNSLVAVVREGQAEVLADTAGEFLLPSVVHYSADKVSVGHSPKKAATKDPQNTLFSVKRLMGRGVEDLSTLAEQLPFRVVQNKSGGMPYIKTDYGTVSPIQVSAEILKVLKARGEQTLGTGCELAVITVPAYFDEAQRQATKDAAQLAGLEVLRLLNEPTAAAVAYGLDRNEEGVIAVYDLGGGTFDISILRLHAGVFEVLATGGDTALGGDDFDQVIANWVLEQAGYSGEISPKLYRQVIEAACAAKEALTTETSTNVNLVETELEWSGALSLATFELLIDPLVAKTLRVCKRALRDAGLMVGHVGNTVLVGGSTRVPLVRQRVAELFDGQPLVEIDPDRVVAIGAAIQADMLVGNRSSDDLLLLDVNPLSLGIETMGGLVEKIIPRNATIPVAKAQEFTTYKDGQTAMAIHVLQGERELVTDCRSLARFELRGIPPMVAGSARIQVTFQIDADGILHVSATELSTGTKSSVEVKPSYGLDESEIASILRDSIEHAQLDVSARQLREKQIEAQAMLDSVRNALEEDGQRLLSAQEVSTLQSAVAGLAEVADGDQPGKISRAIDSLAKASEEFAALRMDDSIKRALQGKTLDTIEVK